MSRGMTKSERLRRLEELYFVRAFSDIEMAEHLKKEQGWEVDRTTVYRDRIQMESELGIPFAQEEGKWRIDRSKYVSSIRLNPHEALSLYLAARRATQQTRFAQRYAASALEKLAIALHQPMTERLVKAADEILAQQIDPIRIKIFETVTEAWVKGRPLNLTYHGLEAEDAQTHRFHIFLIEPAPWSDSVYLIGHSELFEKVTTLKLERVERASIAMGTLISRGDFDEQMMLQHAWGIWASEHKPTLVELRFTAGRAVRRLKESIWHPLERGVDEANGDRTWRAEIVQPREMLPFIRSWGADVEVIKPEWLKEQLKGAAEDLARLYKIGNTLPDGENNTKSYMYLWAKAEKKTYEIHRLVYHMIDVGQAALVLWQGVLNDNLKLRIANWLSLSVDDAGRLIAFWASLHDLGKASPAFQDHTNIPKELKRRILRELQAVGFKFPIRGSEAHARHEVISTWSLRSANGEGWLAQLTGLPIELANNVAQMLGGHHGAFPESTKFSTTQLSRADKGDAIWAETRCVLVQEMLNIFGKVPIVTFVPDTKVDNVMLTMIAGIISAADWLGSDSEQKSFPFEKEILPLSSYTRHAYRHAQLALLRAGWQRTPCMPVFNFRATFGFERHAAQREIHGVLKETSLPALVIIEKPMGSGKTEDALDGLADWMRRATLNGVYIAMPTTATSNQMHERVTAFLQKQLGADIDPLLVHSQALLRSLPAVITELENSPETQAETDNDTEFVEEPAREGDAAAAQSWFLPRKKSLLAPFGVGTVDQALMSILQTKHFFVRLLGLSHKVVIFDEVHAYDAYMSVLFERLLTWLSEIGTSVIVLSATLPDKTRNKLVKAYTGREVMTAAVCYPRLTTAPIQGETHTISLTPPPSKILQYKWLMPDPQTIVERLRKELENGGCAAVICNTIMRAQQIYKAIKQANEYEETRLCDDENTILFHARFPMAWREGIESKVLRKFGPHPHDKAKPNPQRPPKAIVVATQVIEQSLDLDFDVMISDHAPIDLLLQRSGRLQRHKANDAIRKHLFCLLITEPEGQNDGVPQFERADKLVYDEFILLRSWLALKQRSAATIELPIDLSILIEQVYGEAKLPINTEAMQRALMRAQQEATNDENKERFKARQRLVRKPNDEDLLYGENLDLEEDDPRVHETFQALTRSDRPGLSVICLHRYNGELFTEPDGKGMKYTPKQKPSPALLRELLRHSVTIRRLDVEKQLLLEPTDAEVKQILTKWKKIAALRYHRVVIFENHICKLDGTPYLLNLTQEYGLEIKKEAQ